MVKGRAIKRSNIEQCFEIISRFSKAVVYSNAMIKVNIDKLPYDRLLQKVKDAIYTNGASPEIVNVSSVLNKNNIMLNIDKLNETYEEIIVEASTHHNSYKIIDDESKLYLIYSTNCDRSDDKMAVVIVLVDVTMDILKKII